MTRITTSLVAAAVAVAAAGTAAAQGLGRLDRDGDGAISRAEVAAARDALFDRLDRDGDGAIGPAEIAALQERTAMRRDLAVNRIGLLAARRDADGDGAISRAEMGGGPDLFALIDTDGDDVLSAEERERVRALLRDMRL